jgi:hypothetical protein
MESRKIALGTNRVNLKFDCDYIYLFATVPISRTNAYAQTGLMVYF